MNHFKNIILIITVLMLTLFSSAVFGIEYLIGAKAWYANWDSSLKDAGKEVPWMGWQYLETGSGWLYGPNVGIIFSDRINFSVSYMYGKMYSQFEALYSAPDGSGDGITYEYFMVGKNKITRQDIDSALSLQLMTRLRLFLGFKYQIVDMTMRQMGTKDDPTGIDTLQKIEMTFKQENYAPALGLGTSIPLGDMFALTGNVSALYMRGVQHITNIGAAFRTSDVSTPISGGVRRFEATMDLTGYGINVDPAILMYLNDINLVILLGFRYQYVNYDGKWRTPPQGVDKQMDNMSETLYGAYLSILYKI